MLKNNSKCRKKSCNFSFIVTVDRINQLELEFMHSKEFADLLSKRNALEDTLMNAQSEQMKSVLVDFCDVNSDITEQKEKFFYKHAWGDCSATTRLVRCRNRIRLVVRVRQEAASS